MYFAGVVALAVGIVFFFMEALMLSSLYISANPDLLTEQLRMVATYGIIFKMIGTILLIVGVATIIYGIIAKPVKNE
ncbi:MAG: hypothetical protein QXL10_01765 [Candidatus Bathyarchaeia archaeon]